MTQRVFTASDQAWFAQLSGDWNPMHIDPLAARRMQPGAPVVHGLHAVLWALDQLSPLPDIRSIKVQFSKFIYLDTPVSIHLGKRDETMMRVMLVADGLTTTTITLRFGSRTTSDFPTLPASGDTPAPASFEELAGLKGWLPGLAETGFPALAAGLGAHRVQALALLSTLVGMHCPGLQSVFTAFAVDMVEDDRPGLGWKTIRADDRFQLVTIAVGGSIQGEVTAFVRPRPVEPPTFQAIKTRVSPDEFRGRTALVVGGSRGLGAVTAKLLAAGGADVTITYAVGLAEAEALASEIGCRIARCDVTQPIDLAGLPDVTHLYYFATPHIFRQTSGVFSAEAFAAFAAFYIDGFHGVFQWLATHQDSLVDVMAPSSTAVEERPAGLTEYAMAKAAGELLGADLARPGLRIRCPRLPRILTDQTATVALVAAEDPVEVMLPLLRS